jgi:hypothetical protein
MTSMHTFPLPPRDKRSRPDLGLYVLALIERALNTPYRLLSEAGLSQGASISAFDNLARGEVNQRSFGNSEQIGQRDAEYLQDSD